MADYTIKISLQSSFITPLHADTMWGHICWALRYSYGEKQLMEFLGAYDNDTPPLVLSNGLPEGCLPFPILSPLSVKERMELIEKYWETTELSIGAGIITALTKMPYLPKKLLADLGDQPLSSYKLIDKMLSDPGICIADGHQLKQPCGVKYQPGATAIDCRPQRDFPYKCPAGSASKTIGATQAVVFHTAIDRLTGGAQTGSLYNTIEQFPGQCDYEVHCTVNPPMTEEKLNACMLYISHTGFGKKKSTGKGRISYELREAASVKPDSKANAFMCLSNYLPKTGEISDGHYRLLTKYGKLGGHYASSPVKEGKDPVPYKYPLVMFTQGSTFMAGQPKKICYGRIVNGVHPQMDGISHYGLTYPYYLSIEA